MDAPLKSAAEQIAVGSNAVEKSDYSIAANAYGIAAKNLEAAFVSVCCARASALISAEQYDDARWAAEDAVRLAPHSGTSWYWKGTALLKMGRPADAKKSFSKATRYESDLALKASYMDWAKRCDAVEEVETIDATGDTTMGVRSAASSSTAGTPEENGASSAPAAPGEKKPQAPVDNTKMQWYQSPMYVNIDIYSKNVKKEESTVTFESTKVKIRLTRPNAADYVLEKELAEHIIPGESTWSVNKFKVEVRMKKAHQGTVWKSLDKDSVVLSAVVEAGVISSQRKAEMDARKKGWDTAADEQLKDYNEDDSSMGVFRSIYEGADDDARRAMMKSYSESGGQVLSTNWDEVKKEKVTYKETK